MSARVFDWSPPDEADYFISTTVSPTSWTPPQSGSNRRAVADASAFSAAIEDARVSIVKLPASAKPTAVPNPKAYPMYAGVPLAPLQDRLGAWDSNVRGTLVIAELLPMLSWTLPTDVTLAASVSVRDTSGMPHRLADLTRPDAGALLDAPGHPARGKGLNAISGSKPHRGSKRNSVLAEAQHLDLLFMEVMGLEIRIYPRTYELLRIALDLTHAIGQVFKHHFGVPRPSLLWRDVEPIIRVPGHGSYPGGHAAQAHAVAEVFIAAANAGVHKPSAGTVTGLRALADSVADNRVLAGLHYGIDTDAGKAIGQALASWLSALSTATGASAVAWTGRSYAAPTDISASMAQAATLPAAEVFKQLWSEAVAELDTAKLP